MKVLVTGASGFLGRFVVNRLKKQGDDVEALDSKKCDLTREGSLEPYSNTRFDRIYHLAVWTQAGDFCLRHPGEQWLINQKINTNMLDFWLNFQPQAKMLTMGTSCAYDPEYPLKEEFYLKGVPIESLFSYGMTKRMLLAGLESFARQYGLNYLYFIPSTLYGPGYHTDHRQLHFIFDLIKKILRGKHYQEKVVLWGDGHQKRELVFVEDFVEIAVTLADKVNNKVINIGAGSEHTIRKFAELICKETGYSMDEIVFDTTRYVGARSKCLCIDELKSIYPNFFMRSLEEGLKETISWFEEELLAPALK